ncbi:MAG: B12-binding domain-containing protein [Actinomycetota bacterium]
MSADDLTLADAAAEAGLHYMTLYRYVRTGRLPATREGREWRVARKDVEALSAPVAERRPRRGGHDALRRRLEDRMLMGDEAGAWRIVEDALAAGTAPAAIHLRLIVPAMADIGERWARGELRVADEHRASVVAGRLVGRLGPRLRTRGGRRGTIVVGAVTGDPHALPPAIAADLLRAARFEVVDLGADVPAESFAQAASEADRLRAVVVSAASLPEPEHLSAVVSSVRGAAEVPVLVGGAACDAALVAGAGADAIVTLDELVERVTALALRPDLDPA